MAKACVTKLSGGKLKRTLPSDRCQTMLFKSAQASICSMRNSETPGYLVHLLRLWQSEQGGEEGWRASLEEAGSGIRHGFGSLDELYKFIEEQVKKIMANPSVGRAR